MSVDSSKLSVVLIVDVLTVGERIHKLQADWLAHVSVCVSVQYRSVDLVYLCTSE